MDMLLQMILLTASPRSSGHLKYNHFCNTGTEVQPSIDALSGMASFQTITKEFMVCTKGGFAMKGISGIVDLLAIMPAEVAPSAKSKSSSRQVHLLTPLCQAESQLHICNMLNALSDLPAGFF